MIYLYASHSRHDIWDVDLDWLDVEIVHSNPAQGMDVCPRISVLCSAVEVEALRWADPLFESYQMSNWFVMSECNSESGTGPKI
jgi:hypothetical protein